MCSFLVQYHSVDHGWVAVVAQAPDADEARALCILQYGPPAGDRGVPLVQQLDGLPTVYVDRRVIEQASVEQPGRMARRRTGQARVLVA